MPRLETMGQRNMYAICTEQEEAQDSPHRSNPIFCQARSAQTRRVRSKIRDILFAVTEFLGTGSQVPLLLVIDAI
jgi:hypothetical protein